MLTNSFPLSDGFSINISLAPVKTKLSNNVIQALMEKNISRFSYPLVIQSDNGKEFVSKLMEKLLAKLEVAHTTSTSYNPPYNVERIHRTLRTHYRMWTERESMNWTKQLPALELKYNSKVNESTGLTSF